MLKKIDKDRLDQVSRVLIKKPMKFPVATISRELNEETSRVSTYLNGKKPMPERFFMAFMEKYGKESEEEKIVEVQTVTQLELVKLKANIQALNQIVARNMSLQTGKPIEDCLNEIVEITQTSLINLTL